MKKLSAKGKKYVEIVTLLLSITLAFIFWNTFLVYPVKLFVILLHEISHGIAALSSGGTIKGIEISYQLGGYCISSGGNKILIAVSGYLGSILIGCLLFLSAFNVKTSKFAFYFLAILFLTTSIIYIKSFFGIIFSIGFSIILVLISLLPYDFLQSCFIKILGVLSCFYIIFDIKEDLLTTEYRETDATILEKLTSIPSLLWGIIIFILSLITVFFLVRLSFRKLALNKED